MTTDELLELLPACFDNKVNEPFNFFWLKIEKRKAKNIQWLISYECDTWQPAESISPFVLVKTYDESLPVALEKMRIELGKLREAQTPNP